MALPFSRILLAAKVLSAVVLLVSLTGCSDMLTYAQVNRDAGIQAYNEQDYPRASGAFRSALRQDPRDYISHYYLGLSSLQLKNYQQAMVAFRSSLETQNVTLAGKEDNATRLKSMDGLAQAIVKSDAGDQEVNKIEQAARDGKGVLAAKEYFVLAKIYRYRLLPDMALDAYNRATLEDPKNFAFAKEAGLYAEQLQQTKRARDTLSRAYGLDTTDTEVADALRRLGVVPGLSLKDKEDLAKPLVPKGPIPPVDMNKVKSVFGGGNSTETTPAPATPAVPAKTATTPRD